jgi:hypothetical protein
MSNMSRERRGPGKIERSKSGGAVRGRIPKAGGSNKTNFETGISTTVYGKDKAKKKTKSKSKPISDK